MRPVPPGSRWATTRPASARAPVGLIADRAEWRPVGSLLRCGSAPGGAASLSDLVIPPGRRARGDDQSNMESARHAVGVLPSPSTEPRVAALGGLSLGWTWSGTQRCWAGGAGDRLSSGIPDDLADDVLEQLVLHLRARSRRHRVALVEWIVAQCRGGCRVPIEAGLVGGRCGGAAADPPWDSTGSSEAREVCVPATATPAPSARGSAAGASDDSRTGAGSSTPPPPAGASPPDARRRRGPGHSRRRHDPGAWSRAGPGRVHQATGRPVLAYLRRERRRRPAQ